jgi:hypothetical protein
MIHSFNEQLAFSESKNGKLDLIYQNYFQNVTGVNRIDRINEMTRQRAGIDTIVILNSGEKIKTQEKWRTREFTGDFLIEYCSVHRNGECEKPGWIYSIDADYIFAVYAPSELVKIYPVVQLKLAWANNHEEWLLKHRKIRAQNRDYITLSIAVPTDILEKEITRVMKFEYQQSLNSGVQQ